MQQEIEVKFLNVNHDGIRSKLKSLGATRETPMRLMRRVVFDRVGGGFSKVDGQRLRVRDEGERVTMTYKSTGKDGYDNEVEIIVNSFDSAVLLLESLGFEVISYQESKREAWRIGNVEVVLDEWPWLLPYIEIEGESEEDIKVVSNDLGLKWSDGVFGSVDEAYLNQYTKMKSGESIGDVKQVKFDDPIPEFLRMRK